MERHMVCGMECHVLLLDGNGGLFRSRKHGKGDAVFLEDLPHHAVVPGMTPDHAACAAVADITEPEGLTLTGGFSHDAQLPDAPLMLTLPHTLVWMDGILHAVYTALATGDVRVPGDFRSTADMLIVGGTAMKILVNRKPGHSPATLRGIRLGDDVDASTAVFINSRGRTLLHRHPKTGTWLPPGGHMEKGENPVDTAIREALEETGYGISIAGYGNTACMTRDPREPIVLPRPRGIQIERLGNGHEHLDFVYFAEPRESGPPMEPFVWLSRGEADGVGLTPEMSLWCDKACR